MKRFTAGGNKHRPRRHSYWQDDDTINFCKFVLVQAGRTILKDLIAKPCLDHVHYVNVDKAQIPPFVHNLAAKSSKFIPTSRPLCVQHALVSFRSFLRSARLSCYFQNLPVQRQDHRRRTCCSDKLWEPPLADNVMSDLQTYDFLTQQKLITSWPRKQHHGINMTLLDYRAFRWLQQNRHMYKVVDTDKNLGNAIVCSNWLAGECRKWLRKSMQQTSQQDFSAKLKLAKGRLSKVAERALSSQAISQQQARFLLSNQDCNSAPKFRVNVKIHKTPIDSRPICNNANFCLCNAGIFLGVYLQPIVHRCRHVITSSADVVEWANKYKPAGDDMFVSFDIKALYPNLQIWPQEDHPCHADVYTVVSARIWLQYQHQNPNLAMLLDSLLHCILQNQFVEYDGDYFEAKHGLNTGMHAASEIANIYLNSYDVYLTEKLNMCCKQYFRYIDDGLLCIGSSGITEHVVMDVLNTWNPHIRTEPVLLSASTNFLDLTLDIVDGGSVTGEIRYQTYRKPLNIYGYIPASSSHHPAAFESIIRTEAIRLLRTNKYQDTYAAQLRFFSNKLAKRGYSRSLIDRILLKYPFHSKCDYLNRTSCSKQTTTRKCVLKWQFTKIMTRVPIKNCLLAHWHLVSKHACSLQPIVAHTTSPNLFRKLYKYTWARI